MKIIGILFHHLNQENVLVYGAGKVGKAFVATVEKLSSSPLNIVGFVDDRVSNGNTLGNPRPILGGLGDVETIIHKHNIDHIIGVVLAKDLLRFCTGQKDINKISVKEIVREAIFAPESQSIMEVFRKLQE